MKRKIKEEKFEFLCCCVFSISQEDGISSKYYVFLVFIIFYFPLSFLYCCNIFTQIFSYTFTIYHMTATIVCFRTSNRSHHFTWIFVCGITIVNSGGFLKNNFKWFLTLLQCHNRRIVWVFVTWLTNVAVTEIDNCQWLACYKRHDSYYARH